ncbi:hypothetical protein BOX15_Mlig018091g2, partial [Macrostomum lignano]
GIYTIQPDFYLIKIPLFTMSVRHAYTIKDTHSRNITAIGFNPARREVVLGFEDGTLKVWEADPCKFVQHLSPGHQGWVTSIVYWPEIKTFITAGQDGVIMFWSGNSLVDIVHTEEAIYSMAVNIRKSQLVCGTSTGINLYELDKYKLRRHYIDPHDFIKATEHTDIVKCLAYFDSRVFSGGFDQRLIIYESGYHGVREMTPISVRRAHEAGLNNLIVAQDAEHNSWLITSAFDKCVKVWTTDGKLVHRLDDFASPVTGICFIARNKTIWVAAGYHFAFIYEPKSGENVSEFCDTFLAKEDDEVETARKYTLQLLAYSADQHLVFGSTNRRNLVVWKYSQSGCVTTFFTETPIDCLTYTNKAPILIFSTDQQGDIVKWERKQTNAFAFSKESLRASESMEKMLQKKIARRRMAQLKKSPQQLLQEQKREGKRAKKDGQEKKKNVHSMGFRKLEFVEELDVLVAACEDSNVYVIGFDEKAFGVLVSMAPEEASYKDSSNSDAASIESTSEMDDQVTKRVAGYKCRHVLVEHNGVVTCFAIIPKRDENSCLYLVTSGWDQRICIWNLETGDLVDVFRNVDSKLWEERELAADDAILDMCYSPERNELALSSADNLVYIRRFSPVGSQLVLLGTLQGHTADVNCVKWWAKKNCWVTASEDRSIKLWDSGGVNDCILSLNAGGPVQCVCIDSVSNALVVAVENSLKVFEPDNFDLVQKNDGHFDSIRSIIHIPDNRHYVTASWDGRIGIWQAWRNKRAKDGGLISVGGGGLADQSEAATASAVAATPAALLIRDAFKRDLADPEQQYVASEAEWEEKIESKIRELKAAYYDSELLHAHEFNRRRVQTATARRVN